MERNGNRGGGSVSLEVRVFVWSWNKNSFFAPPKANNGKERALYSFFQQRAPASSSVPPHHTLPPPPRNDKGQLLSSQRSEPGVEYEICDAEHMTSGCPYWMRFPPDGRLINRRAFKAHPEAQGLKTFFPLYEAMFEIYDNDDATGEENFTAFESDFQGTIATHVLLDDDEDDVPVVEVEVNGLTPQSKTTPKRRREGSSSYVDHEEVVSFNTTFKDATTAFKEASLMEAKVNAEVHAKLQIERIEMWDALASVEGLTQAEQYNATIMFHREPNLLSGFTLENHKPGYLRFFAQFSG